MIHPTALKLLCLTVFLLMGIPRLNMKFGPLPIYAIDVLLALTFFYAMQIRSTIQTKTPFAGFVIAILVFAILGEVASMITYGSVLQPVYLIIRELLVFSLFFSVSRIVQSSEDIMAVFKAGLLGLIFTSLMMIMSSMPPTRSIANIFFSFSFFEPASEQALRLFDILGDARRGRSLVGMSILSGAFINTFWPFVSLLYRWPGLVGRWKQLALLGTLLAPMAVVMSYSRGAILGMFFVTGGLLFFGSGRSRRGVIIAMLLGLTVISSVGWSSKYFFFDRLDNRVSAMIENPYEDVRETDRIYAYSEPFEHLVENPRFLLIGEGLSVRKIPEAQGGERAGKAYHALFAAAYYAYGMIGSITYMLLVFSGFIFLWKQMQRLSRSGVSSIPLLYSQALFAAMCGMLPWLLLGHAVVTLPRGGMLFFLLFGLIASLKNFQKTDQALENRV